jgi:hypothetical protein
MDTLRKRQGHRSYSGASGDEEASAAGNRLSDPHLEGTDKDPWNLQNVLPLENIETGDLLTFATSTAGGRIAIDELARGYAKAVLSGTAHGLPIIELQRGSFKSGYGSDVSRPAFPITDWEMSKQSLLPPERLNTAVSCEADPDEAMPARTRIDEMDDEIPF